MNDKLFGDGKAVVVQDIDKGDEVGRQVGVRAVNFGRVCKRRRKEWGNEQQEEGDGLEEHFPLALLLLEALWNWDGWVLGWRGLIRW